MSERLRSSCILIFLTNGGGGFQRLPLSYLITFLSATHLQSGDIIGTDISENRDPLEQTHKSSMRWDKKLSCF